APFAYLDNQTGRLTGEAPEIARHILNEMGIPRIEGVLTEFSSLIPGLKAGRFDLIAAGMYITPDRCREVAFSNPTYKIREAFIVPKGNPKDLHGYKQVAQNSQAKLGVVGGTIELRYAHQLGIPDDRIVVFPDPPSALAGVKAGRVDAYAATSLTVQDLLSKSVGEPLERAQPFNDPIINGRLAVGFGAFAFREQDEKFLEEFNWHLGNFIGSETHLERVRPFGFTEQELPGAVTSEHLCESETPPIPGSPANP
ncbi:MAG: ectoine/hydroxyectoine ABC transporter substrate-binding protein EhuB, partial [Nitrospinaceae bacterium]|nr:ectoine/hydroxyectoine ABC transporter substrate-binding protein EhuB [Nitrospinaceae bacterium]NIR56155.1 ectoine/hydroxyectoine ABC transporter substrate-binding protein EhuB [Nitrospinaceae bacterium]NIS86611.1 ectoine/hydroxyectoine ABC transporter substrate-binding protein EhuB [Nitrospinaceae bacterium]NIT83441.1 ectoine/hydroxyectoine ABC transporter substrate-binding protein EhuB [Nitrospinaceae bacterium]NIU45649.1 ectoine/hydroxyectoine ABC transporter substrate-binding protein Ehu